MAQMPDAVTVEVRAVPPEYDFKKSLWKGIKGFGTGFLLPALLLFLSTQQWPQTREQWALLGSGLLAATWAAGRNWWKHSGKDAIDELFPPMVALALCATLGAGCAGVTPALGASRVTTEFRETVTPDGGMETVFNAESRGNVDISAHSYSGHYDPEKGATVAVGQNADGVDSSAQIAAVGQIYNQAFSTVGALAPLIGGTPPPAENTGGGVDWRAIIEQAVAEALREHLAPPTP